MRDPAITTGTALSAFRIPGKSPAIGRGVVVPQSATAIALPKVTDLPLIEDGALGIDIPRPIEARLLQGDWYGNGPEIVLWHPEAELQCLCPLASKAFLPEAIAQLMGAAWAARNPADGA